MILPSKSDTTDVETNYDTTGRPEADSFLGELENDGKKAGDALADVAVKADSANTASKELADRVKKLEESQPSTSRLAELEAQRTIWWDGTGVRPSVPSSGAVIDLATGQVWGP